MGDAYDVLVIGGGTGGYSCALRLAQLGKRVGLIERDDRIGGTCLLRGCIPTKALLQSAAVMDSVQRSEEWGVKATGEPDWPQIRAFEDRIVDKLVKGVTGLLKGRRVDVIQGTAKLLPGPAVEVDGRRVEAADVVLATGSQPKLLPGLQVGERILTSDQALWQPAPASAVIIGAGAIGLEFASFYRSFGAEVTVLEMLPTLAPLEDADVSKEIARAFRRRGIAGVPGASVNEVRDTGSGVRIAYEAKGKAATVEAEVCLVAVGRGPVTDGLELEGAGVELDRGFVKVDAQLQTSAPHVWAVGDVAATPLQLAHVAFTEGYAVAERIAGIDVPEIEYTGIPRVTYCTPEIASVGLTEAQAVDRGHEVDVEVFNFQGVGKANIVGEGGIVKIVAGKGGGPVLGVHMVGPHVTDLVAETMLIVNWEAAPAEVAALIHPHPSLSEAIGEAHLALVGKPLHGA
ncbi:MAG TPA: dihydrolipoyl dehydrogenase [Actinomycetota bacterium]|nr:dihydrolipoyl dehydrogenase [Actinomycetota bacterium]